MNLPKITIGIILYKGEKYIPYFLSSIMYQDYEGEIEYLFRDQDKYLSATKYIKENYPEIYKEGVFSHGENLWHSGGQNKLISQMTGEIYFCCSNDMLYPSNFVSGIVDALVKNEYAQVATCKIRRWNFAEIENLGNGTLVEKIEKSKSNFLDSCGVGISSCHHFYDVGQGENDTGQYDKITQIFGPSGAVTVLKKSVILKLKELDSFVFDEKNVPHYKNDVDLSYRLNWHGVSSIFVSDIIVYHDRQVANKSSGFFEKIKERKLRGAFANRSSLSGHLVVLHKHFTFRLPLPVVVRTLFHELGKFIFILFFERYLLGAYFDFIRKRKFIKKTVKDFDNIRRVVAFMKDGKN